MSQWTHPGKDALVKYVIEDDLTVLPSIDEGGDVTTQPSLLTNDLNQDSLAETAAGNSLAETVK